MFLSIPRRQKKATLKKKNVLYYTNQIELHLTKEVIGMTITKDMSIMEVVQKYPDTIEVFMNSGMGCVGCAAAHFENIEQGALAHGIDLDGLMKGLNDVVPQA